MSEDSLKLKLLKGTKCNIEIDKGIMFKPLTLDEIADYGGLKFLNKLSILFQDLNRFKETLKDDESLKKYSSFDIFLLLLASPQAIEWRENVLEVLNLTTKSTWSYDRGLIIADGTTALDENFWLKMREVVGAEYQLSMPEEPEDDSHLPEKLRELKRKRAETKKEVERIKAKKQKKEGSEFSDRISGLAAKSYTISILNIWDLTMYQFSDQLARIYKVESYEFNLRAMLAGADSKELNVQHWTSKN